MTNIIHAAKQIRIIIRFKVWIKIFFSIHADLIFIRIQHINGFILIQRLCKFEKCFWRYNIIMINQYDIIPLHKCQCLIRIARNSFILCQGNKFYFRICGRILFQPSGQTAICTAIRKTQFPVRISLFFNGMDHFI